MDFRIEELPLEAAVRCHNEQWEEWVEENRLSISHLPDWLLCAARGLNVLDDVQVSVAFGADGAMGFLPWTLRRRTLGGVPYCALETGACLPAYHPDWLAGPAGPELLHHLRMRLPSLGAHAITFTNIPLKGVTGALLEGTDLFPCRHVGEGEVSPVIHIPADWDTYLQSRTSKFRNNLKRKLKKFHQQAGTSLEWFEEEQDVPGLLDAMLEIEAESWKMPAGIAILRDSVEHRYYQHLLPWMASRGAMLGLVLRVRGEPAAYDLRYLWQAEMGEMKSTYKEKYRALSPGAVLQDQTMRYIFEKGIRLYDFLGDITRHKEEWANDTIIHRGYILFASRWRFHLSEVSRKAGGMLKGLRERIGPAPEQEITGRTSRPS